MSSSFGWLDHDDKQRAAMREVVRLFQDKDSVDELGIGSVRDAFSNYFFPGTSVLHTRARYLLFVPWLVAETGGQRLPHDRGKAQLRRNEVKLIESLVAGDERAGVIGRQARGDLKTMPSQIYWPALRTYGVRTWDVSVDAHLRRAREVGAFSAEVAMDDDASAGRDVGFDPDALALHPEKLLGSTTFDLSKDEAAYLQERFAKSTASVLGWLATHATDVDVSRIWHHPQVGEMEDQMQARVDGARRLHYAWRGAPLLYNLMLSELLEIDDWVEDYRSRLDEWEQKVDQHRVLDDWDTDAFWADVRRLNPRLSPATRRFVDDWISLVANGEHRSERARQLVQNREVLLKGGRSRLANASAREQWNGEAGTAGLDYRWTIARSFLTDVIDGLNRSEDGTTDA